MRLSPGETFDRYVIEALLGEGGRGEVYRATDTRLRRKVALKVLRLDDDGGENDRDRAVAHLLREARAAAALTHPNTVAIYDVGEHGGIPFIAMEVVEGGTLRELIGRDLPLPRRVAILADIARALGAAHAARLVHRDVKPENVVVRDDGTVKVLDFGIARRAPPGASGAPQEEGNTTTLTGASMFFGTPAYMAPELVRGEQADGRADQFAWGIVAFELLTGTLPFRTNRGPVALVTSMMNDPTPPMPDVPPEIEAVVHRALAKEPADRFASMDEIAAALLPFAAEAGALALSSSTVRARPPLPSTHSTTDPLHTPSATAPTVRAAGRSRWPLVLGAAFALTLGVGLTLMVRRPAPHPAIAQRAVTPVPTAITDLPLPPSLSPEALAAYREGLSHLRGAAWREAEDDFERAVKLDPQLGAAHLRLSYIVVDSQDHRAREHYRMALMHRADLSPRDQALLDALEPLLQRASPDASELQRRLTLATARFPGDAELISLLAAHEQGNFASERILSLVDRCLAIDPRHADCWQTKARELYYHQHRTEESLAALDRCIEVAPASADCISDRRDIHSSTGACAAALDDARTWVARRSDGRAHAALGSALFGAGQPVSVVRPEIESASAHYKESGQAFAAAHIDAVFAIASGDLQGALGVLEEAQRLIGDLPTEREHMSVALWHARVLEEMGRLQDAGRVADAFLGRHGALLHTIISQRWIDPVPYLWRARLAAGLVKRADYDEAIQALLHRPGVEDTLAARISVWIGVWAGTATSADEARLAIAAIPQGTLAPDRALPPAESVALEAALGKVYMLAGNAEVALPHLVAGVADCDMLGDPFRHVMTRYRLGLAREALADKPGACAAYKAVLDRWSPSSGSVTAKDAARRAKALGCGA